MRLITLKICLIESTAEIPRIIAFIIIRARLYQENGEFTFLSLSICMRSPFFLFSFS